MVRSVRGIEMDHLYTTSRGRCFSERRQTRIPLSEHTWCWALCKIGMPDPHIIGSFVAVVAVVFGSAVLLQLLTRLPAIPLIAVILVAIAATKLVMLPKLEFGPWTVTAGLAIPC
jgi:DoxX